MKMMNKGKIKIEKKAKTIELKLAVAFLWMPSLG
jgi:hypothetical protein